jgi:hypothetical protein
MKDTSKAVVNGMAMVFFGPDLHPFFQRTMFGKQKNLPFSV